MYQKTDAKGSGKMTEETYMFCREELDRMGHGELVQAYLALKERFLEQLSVDAEKDRMLKNLTERMNRDAEKQFGRSTEKTASLSGQDADGRRERTSHGTGQKTGSGNGPAGSSPTGRPETAEAAEKGQPRRQEGCARRVKEGLPVRDIHVTLLPEKLEEIFGGYQWRELPDQSHDVLRYRKACFYIERRHIHVYTAGGKVVRAGKADKMLPKSLMSPEAMAGILEAKFVLGLPVNRLERQAARNGGQLARQTLYGWIIRCCMEYFEILVMRMVQLMFRTRHIQADETPVTVTGDSQDEERSRNCYFWVFSTSELWPGERIVVFQYENSRSTEVLREFLKGYSGTLTCDAYASYQTFEKEQDGAVTVTGCMTHLRRNFVDALKAMKDFRKLPEEEKKKVPAYQAVEKLKEIFRIETPLRELPAEERLRIRQEKIAPKIEELFCWIHSFQEGDFDEGGLMQKALNYGKNQEEYLKRFLEDGYVPMHNSGSERSIIPFCIGRNNWKAIASEDGATAAAYAYSLAETAKANHADPFYYYKFLLEKLPPVLKEHGAEEDLGFLDCFMPWSEGYRDYEKDEKARYQQEIQKLA
ncbi:MAG: IS66 family transposase [Lachnospiraceae bacterium]|nr:IS66 family transposase [Lachnospiraceae bacterium]